ncbi:MAG: hypothetical protein JO255_16330, partial [Alphaproteobacteria bacterium]|nr:hypothetical protein [Alphaproteobacteria bacterium]
HFADTAGFWTALIDRASELGLTRPLFYALRYTSRITGTPVPAEVIAAAARFRPPAAIMSPMDASLLRALTPNHPSCRGGLAKVALFILYVRAHYLRMPLALLVPHLVRKAIRRPEHAAKREAA